MKKKKAKKSKSENKCVTHDNEDDSVSAPAEKDTDQSDLRLCEETVMKDIFADIEDDNDENEMDGLNKQSLIKEEPVEMQVSVISNENSFTLVKSKSDRHKTASNSKISDEFEVKTEMLSPSCNENNRKSVDVDIKSEPQEYDSSQLIRFDTAAMSAQSSIIDLSSHKSVGALNTTNSSEEGLCSDQEADQNIS